MKVNLYQLEQANEAIDDLRHGRLTGSAVIVLDKSLLYICLTNTLEFSRPIN